jgi:hypothetical protein
VSNSLSTDTAFAWPATTLLPPATEEYSNFTFTDDDLDDGFSSEGGDEIGSLSGDETLLLDLLTDEDWLEQEEEQEEEQQPQTQTQQTMDQECYEYFMAEYLKVVGDSSQQQQPQISFPNFVAVSLDMIASFTQASAATAAPNNKRERDNSSTISTPTPSSSSFDFSIQNWQQRVMSVQQPAEMMMASQWHNMQQWQQWQEGLLGDGDDEFQSFEEVAASARPQDMFLF